MELALVIVVGSALVGGWAGLANGRVVRLRHDQQTAETMGVRRAWFSGSAMPKRGLPLLLCIVLAMVWLLLALWSSDVRSLVTLSVIGPHTVGLMIGHWGLRFQFLTSLVRDQHQTNRISLLVFAISFAALLYTLSQGVPQ